MLLTLSRIKTMMKKRETPKRLLSLVQLNRNLLVIFKNVLSQDFYIFYINLTSNLY